MVANLGLILRYREILGKHLNSRWADDLQSVHSRRTEREQRFMEAKAWMLRRPEKEPTLAGPS
jgi:hypothetical protein